MGRKRQIPKESKTLKYFYFIKVNFNGKEVLKFGISNNFTRRFTEYNNSTKSGYLIDILKVFKCDYPKRLEACLKWKMCSIVKPIYKQEYFELEHYDKCLDFAERFAKLFDYKFQEIEDISGYYDKLIDKSIKK